MAEYDLTNLTGLIVDDYQPMRVIMKNVLYALGIKDITEANSGEEALKILQTDEVDIRPTAKVRY